MRRRRYQSLKALLCLTSLLIITASAGSAIADTQGPLTAAAVSGSNWLFDLTNLSFSAEFSDNSYITYSNTLQEAVYLTNFGFSIPSNTVITGIEVEREGQGASASAVDREFRIALTLYGNQHNREHLGTGI